MAFATADDVATRLGRDLTTAEETQVESVLDTVAALIRAAVSKANDWTPSPVPEALKALSIEKAISVVANPLGVASQSESLGSYSHSETYPRASDIGIFLSDEEGRRVRLAVYGRGTDSVMLGSIFAETETP